jgi:hypothetical protein
MWQWVLSLLNVHVLTVSVASAAGTGDSGDVEKIQFGELFQTNEAAGPQMRVVGHKGEDP